MTVVNIRFVNLYILSHAYDDFAAFTRCHVMGMLTLGCREEIFR